MKAIDTENQQSMRYQQSLKHPVMPCDVLRTLLGVYNSVAGPCGLVPRPYMSTVPTTLLVKEVRPQIMRRHSGKGWLAHPDKVYSQPAMPYIVESISVSTA